MVISLACARKEAIFGRIIAAGWSRFEVARAGRCHVRKRQRLRARNSRRLIFLPPKTGNNKTARTLQSINYMNFKQRALMNI